jgi:DNA modification methylase
MLTAPSPKESLMLTRSNETRPTGKLKPHPKNVRVHPNKEIQLLAENIKLIGFTNPILIDENDIILCGHARVAASERIGLREVPVVVLKGLTELQKRTCLLADNKLADKAGYDRSALAIEIKDLGHLFTEAGLDFELTGFEAAEIDGILGDLVDPEQDPADELPSIIRVPVSRKGDFWQLGAHRLLCGDATSSADVCRLMARQRAAMIIADAPYNLKIKSIQGRGKIKHREFAQASGEMSSSEFTKFLNNSMALAAQHSIDGSLHFWFMDWRHVKEILLAGTKVYAELKNIVVWVKTSAGQGSFYRSQHEFVFAFLRGEAQLVNNVNLGRHGRNRSNVWSYPGANSFRAGRMDDLAIHPTIKPVALVADAMRDCSRRGDLILDPFMGSGTTILAAERVGRRGYGLEIDPLYVDASVRRWQNFTKRDAILKGTGQTFDEVSAGRSSKHSRRMK